MKTYGLPKEHLLKNNREFDRVYRSGKRCKGNGFSIIYLQAEQKGNRLGISVQRKVGCAVRRNRIKRIIREVFRLNRTLFPSNADIVITVRQGFSAKNTAEFYRSALDALCN
jgi:ribonuclease P protein component